ncbi:MAG: hypothetical protein KDA87_05355 [Planctomycetales bacterium]|nr:hypothetical protein [Planctomycetales bacterium]
MTKQSSFKRRIRKRMSQTGERYVVARAALIAQAQAASTKKRKWVSMPETSDQAILEATGRSWNEWCDLLESWPGHTQGHAKIAKYVQAEYEIGAWWAQSVTVGFERITGLRLPGQMSDGTFTANKSKTVSLDESWLRKLLLDPSERQDLFPGHETELRSKPSSKTIRLAMDDGIVLIGMTPEKDGRLKIAIQHTKLANSEDAQRWKFYWGEWLDAISDTSS